MPLREDILNPIAGDNPSGQNLRYAPVYDKIKEARREDDDAAQGDWQRERKLADWPQVIKLASEAIATKSKDIQLAAWLTEALLKREGVAGLREGLTLCKSLLENFWDTLYPELEDGEAEYRAAPLEWLGLKQDHALKSTPVTKSGYNWFQYKESRAVGYEADADASELKREQRANAISDGKLTAEDFDSAFNKTSKEYYVNLLETYDSTIELVESLDEFCQEKFGEFTPSYSKLREALQEVRQTVNTFVNQKRQAEPDADAAPVEEAPADESSSDDGWSTSSSGAAAAPARAPARRASLAAEPADREDAINRVIVAAEFLRREDPSNPAPYMMLRGLRWGELRAGGYLDPALLDAPPTEIRQELKRLAMEGSWDQVLATAEKAQGMTCGRGWLDLQRYAVRACSELGYEPIANAIRSELAALLADYPGLAEQSMMDDTPTGNAETQNWLKEQILSRFASAAAAPAPEPEPSYSSSWSTPSVSEEISSNEAGEPKPPDVYELAQDALRSGRTTEAVDLLQGEIARERSGRSRFQRKVQLAQICLMAGFEQIAYPILEQLASEIDKHGLEDWEAAEMVAHPLVLLFRCVGKVSGDADTKRKIYARICRLDPAQAIACSR